MKEQVFTPPCKRVNAMEKNSKVANCFGEPNTKTTTNFPMMKAETRSHTRSCYWKRPAWAKKRFRNCANLQPFASTNLTTNFLQRLKSESKVNRAH